MVENGGGGKKRKNRNKKNKQQQQQQQQQQPQEAAQTPSPSSTSANADIEDASSSSREETRPKQQQQQQQPKQQQQQQQQQPKIVQDEPKPVDKMEALRILAKDFVPNQYAELREAEKRYGMMMQARNNNKGHGKRHSESRDSHSSSSLTAEIAKARQHIKNSLDCVEGIANLAGGGGNAELIKQVKKLENENKTLKKVTDDLKNLVVKLESRIEKLEKGGAGGGGGEGAAKPAAAADDDDDDDVDLFGSDDEEEDAEKARIREERLKAYAEKKAKKPGPIAKTSVLFDVKPWDDETDMDAMLKAVKSIEKEGLLWGASKLVPVGYGINKLQVMCVVEDEKVSIDELQENITDFEDFVQSVDIAAMSKI